MAIYLNNTTIKRGNSGIPIINEGESKPEQTKTATPSLSQQTISPDSGYALSGVTVEPITSDLLTSLDSDFKAENIAEGVDMFGVAGTHAGGGGGSVETCTVAFSSNVPDTAGYVYDKIFLTVFENNEITTKTVSRLHNITVSNVVFNSSGAVIYTRTPDSISTTNATALNSRGMYMGFTFTGNASIHSTMTIGGGGGAT